MIEKTIIKYSPKATKGMANKVTKYTQHRTTSLLVLGTSPYLAVVINYAMEHSSKV